MTNSSNTPGISQPGRNSFFENIFRAVTSVFRSNISGSQRHLTNQIQYSTSMGTRQRLWDNEIEEIPVRNYAFASNLIEFIENCPEASTAIEVLTEDVFSNPGGDDTGFKIGDPDEETTIDPMVEKIGKRLIDEVIGGLALEPAVERMLAYGDAFISLGFGKLRDGSIGINRILYLPTWEIFRVEDNQGYLLGFEQRKSITDNNPIPFHPIQIVHGRYRKKFLYGRSLFTESLRDWQNLDRMIRNHPVWVEILGNNPTVHIMPVGADNRYKNAYREDHEAKKREGLIADYYLLEGHDLKRLSDVNPNLESVDDSINLYRTRIIMKSRVPIWMFAGLDTTGAREISGQPALSYSRHINRIRMSLVEMIDRMIKIELTLKGIPPERQKFKIIFPPVYVDPLSKDEDEQDNEDEETNSNNSNGQNKSNGKQASTQNKQKQKTGDIVPSGNWDSSINSLHPDDLPVGEIDAKPLNDTEQNILIEWLEDNI